MSIRQILLFVACTSISIATFSQGTVPGYHDPALSRNKLLREQQAEGVYKLIATYKVIGSPYLFGEKINGNLSSPAEQAQNIDLSYNTFNQEIEFYSTSNRSNALIKSPGEVDSFTLKENASLGISKDLKFVFGKHAGTDEKSYFQVIAAGPKFSLYKRYKSDLGYVSTNYVQSELRQFDLLYDYFYFNSATKTFKKIKFNLKDIVKEFKSVKDVSALADKDAFYTNPEGVAKNIFDSLNQ